MYASTVIELLREKCACCSIGGPNVTPKYFTGEFLMIYVKLFSLYSPNISHRLTLLRRYTSRVFLMYFNNLKVETQFFIFKNELTDIIINIRVCTNRNLVHDTSINNNWKIRHFKDYEEV